MSRPLTEAERAWLQEVGARLRQRRRQCGMTQLDLMAAAGVSNFTISRVETGAHLAAVVTLARLCRALNWSLAALLGDGP